MSPTITHLLTTSRFRVEQIRGESPAGLPWQREVVRHPGAVTILPVLDDGRICLIRNRRVAVDQVLIELPAGTREPNESAEETARRELLEETGYRADSLTRLAEFYLSPGILDERMHLFLAEGLTAQEPKREAGEEIENLIVSREEALALIAQGDIQDAKTMVGLLWPT